MKRRVLVVDDNEINRAILIEMLRGEYNITEAEDGEEALEILKNEGKKISAVLLDIIMPKLDGFEVLRCMQGDPQLERIPVLVTTGSAESDSEVKALSLGASDFITKPYNTEVLKHRLWNLIHLRESADKIEASRIDELTGLYNRKSFLEEAAKMVAKKEAGYYVMSCFDIESFKIINDQYGTKTGDEVLKYIADTINRAIVSFGGVCCRVASDNFAMLYPCSFIGSKELEKNHRDTTTPPGIDHPIVVRIGRYIVNDLSLSVNAMYDRASMAEMSIRGRYDKHIAQYDETMRESLIREQQIVNEMYDALKDGQFEPWFQPQYNHASGALIGAEILVRWRRPNTGLLVPPNDFIPVFERNGFIYEMDKYIWESACLLIRKWIVEGNEPIPVSVNISRVDLFREDFFETITGFVKKYDVPVDLLRLEITESAFANSAKKLISVVNELIEYGFTVEIDDFGSGYSSLNILKDVPATVLKLDMKLLESSHDSKRAGSILESVVRMAKWLGMSVIAEGVETLDQADYLKSIGCYNIQGYLYAKPMTLKAYEKLVAKSEKERKIIDLETVENLDSNAFWDPNSMDTLIFNRFVGAACIFEYHDEKIEIIRANDRYAKTIGGESCTTEFILNMRWEDHMDAEAAMVTKAAVDKAIETGDDVTFEAAYINLPGAKGKTYLRATFRLIAKTSDRYLLYGTDENITAQREAEEKEKKTEKKRLEAAQQLQAIMNSMNGGVYAVTADTDGNVNIVFTNEQYYSMFGYTKEQFEFEGADIFSVVHPDEREKIRGKINRLLKSGEYAVMEYSCKKQDGNIVYVRCDAAITKIDGIGERVLISIITDMTETVRTERALKQASIRLKAIMENINGGITATIIRDGHPMLLFANDQYFIQLGLESREQYTQDYELKMAMMHPEDRDWVVAQANKLSETNTSGTIIYRIVRPDGGIRWIQSNISLSNLPDVAEPVQLAVTNDITELREAEQKEREMSDRYRAIMENIGSAVSVISIEGERIRHILANNRYYDIFGYTEEQYREEFGDRVGPISPADRKRVMRELDKAVNSDELVLLDYRAIRRDKKEIWIRHRLISTEIEGIEGRVQLSIMNDVTAEKLLEQNERRSSERLKAIMDNVDLGITAMIQRDDDVDFIFANERYYKQLGYTREQYEKEVENTYDLICPEDRQQTAERSRKLLQTGETAVLEYRVRRRDGRVIWMRAAISEAKFEGINEPVQLAILRDIDKVKKAEEKLRALNEKIRSDSENIQTLMNDTPGGFCKMQLFEDKPARLIYANDGFCRLIGMTRDEIEETYGKDAMGSVHPDDYAAIMSTVADKIKNGGQFSARSRILCKNGEYLWIKVEGRFIKSKSDETYLNCYFSDINEQLKEEERQKELLDNLPSGAALYRYANGKISAIHLNKRYRELVGRSIIDLENVSVIDAMHPDDRSPLFTAVEGALRDGRDIVFNMRLRYGESGDEYRLFRALGRTFRNPDGSINIYATFSPISETELSLQEMLPRILSAIMESTSDLSFAKDKDLRYICGSNSFLKMAGVDNQDEIVGKTDYDLFEKDIADKFRSDDLKLIESGESIVDIVERIPSSDGVQHYSSTSKYLLSDTLGNTIGLYGTGRDITEYRTAFERLHILTENIPGGIAALECSPRGIKLIYFSEGLYDYSGYRKEEYNELVKDDAMALIFPEDRKTVLETLEKLKTDNNCTASCNYRCRTKDGEFRWFSMRGVVSERNGDTVIINIVQLDVTDAISAEESEKATRLQLEASHRAIEFACSETAVTMWLYDIDNKCIDHVFTGGSLLGTSNYIENLPDAMVDTVDPESRSEFLRLYKEISNDADRSECTAYVKNLSTDEYEWQHIVYVRLRDSYFNNRTAVGICVNVDAQQEARLRYEHELRLRHEIVKDSILYYEVNLNTGVIEEYQSKLLDVPSMRASATVDENVRAEILNNVAPEYRDAVENTIFRDALVKAHERGETSKELVYRRKLPELGYRWVKSTVTIMQRPGTDEVIAFLYTKDIDAERKDQLTLDSIIDEEIESVALVNVKSGLSHIIKSNDESASVRIKGPFDHDEEILKLIDSNVVKEERRIVRDFFLLENLDEVLTESPFATLAFRINVNGKVLRKRTLAYYLDETHEDIVLSRRDITSLYEEEQRQKQVLQEAVDAANAANHAKSDFLSRMSHDMRTPLTAILALSGKEMTLDATAEDKDEYLKKVHTSGEYLLGIINDVLDMARIENKKITLNLAPYELAEFRKTVDTVIGAQCEAKGIEFNMQLIGTAFKYAMVDKVRFNQIFINLLSNAVKFTPEGGKVDFIMEAVALKDNCLTKRFTIRDNGIGMSADFLPHAFESFAQENQKGGSENNVGTGLGLPIVKQLVEMMGGTVSVESELGKGTTFTVVLSYEEAPAPDGTTVSKDIESALMGTSVLLCEDNSVNAMIVSKMLTKRGCTVEHAENGQIGVEMFRKSKENYYDIILMDIRMPVMNGLKATEAIRALDREDAKSIPIIALTADAFSDDEKVSLGVGMTGHVAKPINAGLLFSTISTQVGKKAAGASTKKPKGKKK